jgi:hypothetical protein
MGYLHKHTGKETTWITKLFKEIPIKIAFTTETQYKT